MATLTVKNVGPIREAELEVKKHTVFIGPQGSGKSTLAKLIAIISNINTRIESRQVTHEYNLEGYFNNDTIISYGTRSFKIALKNQNFNFDLTPEGEEGFQNVHNWMSTEIEEVKNLRNFIDEKLKSFKNNINYDNRAEIEKVVEMIASIDLKQNQLINKSVNDTHLINAIYIPSERTLIAILSKSIWSLIQSGSNLPKGIITFASSFETARSKLDVMNIPFLDINYKYEQGTDKITYQNINPIELDQSASGYQSIIPLLLVIEYQRRIYRSRFIIEEPELNLYPTAQKDLIYSLIGGLQPDVDYKEAEWVITTHSPYVLSSFNTLMLAYKVAQRSDELRAEVEKIIPARCWINPDEFAAYYVDKGTVRSIISEKTGLIADNELDNVSDDLGDEQDKLFELSRSVPRA